MAKKPLPVIYWGEESGCQKKKKWKDLKGTFCHISRTQKLGDNGKNNGGWEEKEMVKNDPSYLLFLEHFRIFTVFKGKGFLFFLSFRANFG